MIFRLTLPYFLAIGHAALPLYRVAPSTEPKRAGDAFQPGSWEQTKSNPSQSQSQGQGQAQGQSQQDIPTFKPKEKEFEPEAWQPGKK